MGYHIHWIKHPAFGSGKIHRRVKSILVSQTFGNRFRERNNDSRKVVDTNKAPVLIDSKVKFPEPKIKILFQCWNTKGHPFVRHHARKSKTITRIISQLTNYSKKYEQRRIAKAIDDGFTLFSHPGFYYKHMYSSRKIGLHNFLGFTASERVMFSEWANVKQVAKRHGVEFPASWFDECLKGWEYLSKTYIGKKRLIDNYPEITEQAIKMMQMHLGRQLNEHGKEKLVLFSKMLVNFANLNKLDYLALFDRISDALNSFHTIKVSKVYYLTTNIFWADTLPAELIRFNKNKYEDMNFISDKELLIK